MLLVIDSGNTNVVFAIYEGQEQKGCWRATSDSKKTADEYAVWLTQLMALKGLVPGDITGSILANVVPASTYNLTRLCEIYFNSTPLMVELGKIDLGLTVRIDQPEQAGADRLVNAVAGYQRYGGNLILIDFGTATTFDIVGDDGAYEGGVIAPGVNLSVEALYMASAKLPRIDIRRPKNIIGKATIPAMESGIFWGYVSMVEGMVKRIREEYGAPMQVVATGGLAQLFTAATEVIDHLDKDVTLRGLISIYELNTRDKKVR
ncbi:type III pantothenate kinase [Kiloniella laminariae]|uniref:Type III pantothenate kinase n=1 Tax=Kiloniella laminariae TaxID=454162 RepID=A0ABT4LLN3_9PROT|nr:type III pantothenate kinase [Kiloniella laminariae]MCZ4282013.1 type III pantothenate kinase [Kiloniella laminariae]